MYEVNKYGKRQATIGGCFEVHSTIAPKGRSKLNWLSTTSCAFQLCEVTIIEGSRTRVV